MLTFPQIDPIIFSIGPVAIRWYSMAYVFGIILGCLYADWLRSKPPVKLKIKFFDDFITWAIIGIIIGGRSGYVLFYNLGYYIEYPENILKLWQGGMSFHGGLLGVIAATILYSKKYKFQIMPIFDIIACAGPIGLFFGRIANFINGELYGRVTNSPLGMIFPNAGPLPRHPSQIYEAILEGLLLFIILFILAYKTNIRKIPGILSGIFLGMYGIARFIVEYFREPDAQIGFIIPGITTGQILSLPMILLGVIIIIFAYKNKTNNIKVL